MEVEGTETRVLQVEAGSQFLEDGDVDWVGSGCGVIFAVHGSVEIIQYGILLVCARVDAWIRLVQVGEPLADGR